jgi:hypothetical protein
MRGLADSQTLTGQVQRVLDDQWRTQGQIVYDARLHSVKSSTLTALLERLIREGRAESRRVSDPFYMSGGRTEYRRSQ